MNILKRAVLAALLVSSVGSFGEARAQTIAPGGGGSSSSVIKSVQTVTFAGAVSLSPQIITIASVNGAKAFAVGGCASTTYLGAAASLAVSLGSTTGSTTTLNYSLTASATGSPSFTCSVTIVEYN